MRKSMKDWLEDGDYLPEFMRDFHDAKKVFKRVHWLVEKRRKAEDGHYAREIPNWNVMHIYVIDFFLWFMAQRGYTLQKTKRKDNYVNIWRSMDEVQERNQQIFLKIIENEKKKKSEGDVNNE